MTQSTRTIRTPAEVRASIQFVSKAIDDLDAYRQEIYNAYGDETASDWFVVAFDNGLGLNAMGSLGGALRSRLYPTRVSASRALVRNGKGEWAKVMTYGDALAIALRENWKAYDGLCTVYADLREEMVEAYAYADHLEMEAAKAAYEDEHARKNPKGFKACRFGVDA